VVTTWYYLDFQVFSGYYLVLPRFSGVQWLVSILRYSMAVQMFTGFYHRIVVIRLSEPVSSLFISVCIGL